MTERRENIARAERMARAMWEADGHTPDAWTSKIMRVYIPEQDRYRRLADVAIAADDGAHGPGKCVSVEDANRVLADERRGYETALAAVGAPATAEDSTIPWHPCPVCGGDGCDVEAATAGDGER